MLKVEEHARAYGEDGAEEFWSSGFKIAQDLAVRLDALPQVKQIARAAGDTCDHGYLVPRKDMVLDDGQVVLYIFDFVLDRTVQLFQHVVEHVSRVVTQIAFVEQGIDLKNLGEFVERVNR